MKFKIMLESLINGGLIPAGTVMDVQPAGFDAAGEPILHVPAPHWFPIDDEAKAAYEAAGHVVPVAPNNLEVDDRPEVQPDAPTHPTVTPGPITTATPRDNMNRPILVQEPGETDEAFAERETAAHEAHEQNRHDASLAAYAAPIGSVPTQHGVNEVGRVSPSVATGEPASTDPERNPDESDADYNARVLQARLDKGRAA